MAEPEFSPGQMAQDLVRYRNGRLDSASTPETQFLDYCLKNLLFSRAQLLQDLFVQLIDEMILGFLRH